VTRPKSHLNLSAEGPTLGACLTPPSTLCTRLYACRGEVAGGGVVARPRRRRKGKAGMPDLRLVPPPPPLPRRGDPEYDCLPWNERLSILATRVREENDQFDRSAPTLSVIRGGEDDAA
jgi:hypothetical protein